MRRLRSAGKLPTIDSRPSIQDRPLPAYRLATPHRPHTTSKAKKQTSPLRAYAHSNTARKYPRNPNPKHASPLPVMQ